MLLQACCKHATSILYRSWVSETPEKQLLILSGHVIGCVWQLYHGTHKGWKVVCQRNWLIRCGEVIGRDCILGGRNWEMHMGDSGKWRPPFRERANDGISNRPSGYFNLPLRKSRSIFHSPLLPILTGESIRNQTWGRSRSWCPASGISSGPVSTPHRFSGP